MLTPVMPLRLATNEVVDDRRRPVDKNSVPLDVLREVLAQVQGGPSKMKVGIRSSFSGKANCVLIRPGDQFVKARRPGKEWETTFVLREPEETDLVTLVLAWRGGGHYGLIAAYFGEPAPPEPEDQMGLFREDDSKAALAAARVFWATHALVLGCMDVVCSCGEQIPKEQVVRTAIVAGRILCLSCRG